MAILELDIENVEQLQAYLAERSLIAASEKVTISMLAGGVSSRTMLVERECGDRWVIKQALAALRVHVEWLSSPERSSREAEGARVLAQILPDGAVPRIVFEDRQNHLFGMTAVASTAANWKSLLLAGEIDLNHFRLAGELLASIHRESAVRRGELPGSFNDASFFESLRLEPYYEYTARCVPEAAGFLDALCKSTRSQSVCLVHGDFSPKNLMVDGERMILLDHEVIHVGDPAFDAGFVLAHFLSKAHHLPGVRARILAGLTGFWRRYSECAKWNFPIEPRAAAHALGCLLARVAGRSQLEYLGSEEKRRQLGACVRLTEQQPETVGELTMRFIKEIQSCP